MLGGFPGRLVGACGGRPHRDPACGDTAAPIVGALRLDPVRENAVAADIDLDAETIAEIEALSA